MYDTEAHVLSNHTHWHFAALCVTIMKQPAPVHAARETKQKQSKTYILDSSMHKYIPIVWMYVQRTDSILGLDSACGTQGDVDF